MTYSVEPPRTALEWTKRQIAVKRQFITDAKQEIVEKQACIAAWESEIAEHESDFSILEGKK